MRYLILSDIHANHLALRSVLKGVKKLYFHRMIVPGDLVGYGVGCNESIHMIRNTGKKTHYVRGNHDKVVCGLEDGSYFNPVALTAAAWTRNNLTEDHIRFLRDLPPGPVLLKDDILVCHGSPLDEDEYIFTDFDAYRVFQSFPNRIIIFGHTHIPMVFSFDGERLTVTVVRQMNWKLKLDPKSRYLINPGSVGQPRDKIPHASYALLDSKRNTLTIERVPYDVTAMQDQILNAELPPMLARRLREGL